MDVFSQRGIRPDSVLGRVTLNLQEIRNYEVREGDVFFTRTSETLNEVGISSVMLGCPTDTVFSGFVLRARPKSDKLNNQYKKYCFSTRQVRNQIISQSTETTRALTNGRALSKVLICVPPLAEQEAIAEALSDADAYIESLEKLIAKKRLIKQGAMQELLSGKRRLPGFSGEWEVKRLGEIAMKFLNGGTPSTARPEFWEGSIPWITGADIIDQKITERVGGFITLDAVKNSATNIIEKGNLLVVTRTGVGKVALAPFDLAISQDLTGVYPGQAVAQPEFLHLYLSFNKETLKNLVQGTSIAGITRDTLTSLLVFNPPLGEQAAIAEVFSDMDAEISALEEKLAKARRIKHGMMQELLTGRIRLVQGETTAPHV